MPTGRASAPRGDAGKSSRVHLGYVCALGLLLGRSDGSHVGRTLQIMREARFLSFSVLQRNIFVKYPKRT